MMKMDACIHLVYTYLVSTMLLPVPMHCSFPTCESRITSMRPINHRLKVAPLTCELKTDLRQCAEECSSKTECLSVVYNRETNMCEHFTESRSVLTNNDFVPEAGALFLDINEYKPSCNADPCRSKPCGTKQRCYRHGQSFICLDTDYKCDKRLVTGPYGVEDNMLSVSSNLDNSRIRYLRLNTVWDGWQPRYGGTGQWAQVRFYRVNTIVGVITAGRPRKDYWVKSFKVLYSTDCVNFENILDKDGAHKIFPGNTDKYKHVENYFERPYRALCVRINPWTYRFRIGLRFDVIGCCNKIQDGLLDS